MDAGEANKAYGKRALVVEGGAMRGIFAAGVLDAFIEQQHYPYDACYGVSAGSTALAAYLSGQKGRTRAIIADYSCRPEFINFRRFFGGGHLLDLDWLWPITLNELPFDFDAFERRAIPLLIGVTEVNSGQGRYLRANRDDLAMLMKASCSVPVGYRGFVSLNGQAYTDGGVADSIPVRQAYQQGYRDLTVVLSQPLGYRKRPSRFPWLLRWALREHPPLLAAMEARHRQYNQTLAFISEPPKDCRIRVLVPPPAFAVGRLTRAPQALASGYELGRDCGLAHVRRQAEVLAP
ncbi:patatin-like phospholipase family protein [Ferrimonas kyonanensis]|uniref:patatin-like phospholipase family protein n=1 Tax=Ferrimonas kyonanensis TaxID=364763 RepID=UPI0003F728E0|nr:patatin family protein [Ferrimonas kyonanensis]